MCGIYGITAKDPDFIQNFIEVCKHRGPDGQGIWNDDSVTLGHNLLSIMANPNNSQQPWKTPKGNILVYNGEIFNYYELKAKHSDFIDTTGCDTELLAWGLDKFGLNFIDEIDSFLSRRKSDEDESSRKIKNEFLVQLDGVGNKTNGRVQVIGATNFPQELDDAARRRFEERFYIPMPDRHGREALLRNVLSKNSHTLTDKNFEKLSRDTEGYSGADMKTLCKKAAHVPFQWMHINANSVLPPISYEHFCQALSCMKPSVAQDSLQVYDDWNTVYGNKAHG